MTSGDNTLNLLLAVGNRSRGDDAAGPFLLDQLRPVLAGFADISWQIEECYQLQPELVEEIRSASRIWVVDATREFSTGAELISVSPAPQFEFTTHALSVTSLLALYAKVYHCPPPPTQLLKIGASEFELGAPISAQTRANIDTASRLFQQTLIADQTTGIAGNPACTS